MTSALHLQTAKSTAIFFSQSTAKYCRKNRNIGSANEPENRWRQSWFDMEASFYLFTRIVTLDHCALYLLMRLLTY